MVEKNGTESNNSLIIKPHQVFLALLGLISMFIILTLIFPEVFYDKFLYKYYIKSYLEDGSYNPIDTTTYGLMIAGAIYGIFRMLKKLDISVDERGIYCIIPWMLMGGTYRSLEDAEFFREPVIYMFRSPMIYLSIAITVIVVLLYYTWAHYLSQKKKNWKLGFALSLAFILIIDLLYLLFHSQSNRFISYRFTPLYPFILTVPLSYLFYFDARRRDRADMKTGVLALGIYFLAISALPIASWPNIKGWTDHYSTIAVRDPLVWGHFFLVIGIALSASFLLMGVIYLFRRNNDKLKVFFKPLSFLIIFGHMMDATATYMGIEFFGYYEKHALPHFLIGLTGTALVMYLLKIPLVILAIYILDIAYRDDFRENPDLMNLVKMGIIILGLAPGLRDALRMAMGV